MGTHFQTAAVVLHTSEKSREDVAISWPLVAFCRGRLESALASGDRNYSKREGGWSRRENEKRGRGGGRKGNGGDGGKGGVRETETCRV